MAGTTRRRPVRRAPRWQAALPAPPGIELRSPCASRLSVGVHPIHSSAHPVWSSGKRTARVAGSVTGCSDELRRFGRHATMRCDPDIAAGGAGTRRPRRPAARRALPRGGLRHRPAHAPAGQGLAAGGLPRPHPGDVAPQRRARPGARRRSPVAARRRLGRRGRARRRPAVRPRGGPGRWSRQRRAGGCGPCCAAGTEALPPPATAGYSSSAGGSVGTACRSYGVRWYTQWFNQLAYSRKACERQVTTGGRVGSSAGK